MRLSLFRMKMGDEKKQQGDLFISVEGTLFAQSIDEKSRRAKRKRNRTRYERQNAIFVARPFLRCFFFRLCPLFNRDESRDINYPEIYTVHFVKQSCTRNHVKMEKFRYTVCAKPSPVIYSHFNITTIVSRTFFFSPVCASHFDSVTPSVTLFFTRTLLRRIFACYIFPRLIL